MSIIGPGLTLVGGHFNSSLLALALHTTTPPTCPGLQIPAQALGMPVLYVHIQSYDHPKMTAFNSLRKISANVLEGVYDSWMQPDHLMYLDCFDNFLTHSPEKILERLAEFNTELLISAEENCWPDPTQVWSGLRQQAGRYLELFESAPHIRTPNCLVPDFRFANLGGIIGTPRAINDMAKWVLTRYPGGKCIPGEPYPNDQACLHHFVLDGMDRTGSAPKLDCGHIFFPMWNFFMGNIFPYVHLESTPVEQWPAVFHANGHVTKPIIEALKNCLSTDPNLGFEFPLETERRTIEFGGPVAQNILLPLCRHLKAIASEQGPLATYTSGPEYDSRFFEWK